MRWGILCLIIVVTDFHAARTQSFPNQLTGRWTGVMYISKDGKVRDSVNIRFTVTPGTDAKTWSWKTEYLSEKLPMTKDYKLRLLDETSQMFALDEGDGVVLNGYLFGNKLYSVFETQDVLLTSTYELRSTELIFEVTSGKKIPGATDVNNYTVQHVQRAVLRRLP